MKNGLKVLVRKEINRIDPVGLLSMGAPKDEYNPEVEEIVKKIGVAKSEKEVEELVYKTFVKMFGSRIAGVREKYSNLATNISRRLQTL